MKVTITSWTAVAAWRWDVREDDDLCGICRVDFDATCPTCKFPGDECPLIQGTCKHTFHSHCLSGWLNQDNSQGRCPMCRQPFEEFRDPATIVQSPSPTTAVAADANANASQGTTLEQRTRASIEASLGQPIEWLEPYPWE